METTTEKEEIITLPLIRKVMTWETNYNLKMGCTAFIHLDLHPVKDGKLAVLPRDSEIERMVVEIRTADQTHPPVVKKLRAIQAVKFHEISEFCILPSHGMTAIEFANFMFAKHRGLTWESMMCIYYYIPLTEE